MKHIFIINPNSGRNKKYNIHRRILEACEKNGIDYVIHLTKGKGEAEKIVRRCASKETDKVVFCAVGGDGTVNEVLNGMFGTDHYLSVIPSGSGNDFYRTIVKSNKEYINCDVGKINERYFLNVACIGIDADIAGNVERMRHNRLIPVSQRYNLSIIYTFFSYKFKNLKVKFGDITKQGKYTITTICNSQYYGSGYRIAPHALLDDGMFDIYTVEKMFKPAIIPLLLKLKKGKHEEHPKVCRFSDNQLEIVSDKLVSCNIDGEEMLAKTFVVSMLPNAVTIYKNTELLIELGIEKYGE